MYEVKDIPKIPSRKPDTHKGDYGRVFVLAGSSGMTGAACMCSTAALRAYGRRDCHTGNSGELTWNRCIQINVRYDSSIA